VIRSGEKLEAFFSIYILDLCFIMPAFLIVAFLAARNRGLGLLMTPALFAHGFTLLFPVAVGGMLGPVYGQVPKPGETAFFLVLSVVFLLMALVYLRTMKIESHGTS